MSETDNKPLGWWAVFLLIVFGILLKTYDVYGDIHSLRTYFSGQDNCMKTDIVSFLRDADEKNLDYLIQEMKSLRREANETALGNLNRFSNFEDFLEERAGKFSAIPVDSIVQKDGLFGLFRFPTGGPGYILWKLKPIFLDNGPDAQNLTELITRWRDTNTTITLEKIKELVGKHLETHVKFGIATSIVLTLSFLLTTIQWYKVEDGSQKLLSLAALLLQCYPQFKAVQILYYGWKEENAKWKDIKDKLESTISHVEPFVESWPQVVILWMYLGLSGQWFCSWFAMGVLGMKFYMSVFSAVWGVFKFLKEGPCKFNSFIGAALVAITASATAGAKIPLFYLFFNHLHHGDRILPTILVLSLCYILPFLHACFVLYLALGIKKGMSTIMMYPALVMLPALSCVTFGPVSEGRDIWSMYKKDEPKIQFSWRLTWVNMIMTICGIAASSVGVGLITGFDFLFIYVLYWVAVWLAVGIFDLTMLSLCRYCCEPKCLTVDTDPDAADNNMMMNNI